MEKGDEVLVMIVATFFFSLLCTLASYVHVT